MTPLKTQLKELKKGRNETYFGIDDKVCQAKISLLSQIIVDLKKEWQLLEKEYKKYKSERAITLMEHIEQLTGMSSEELKR